jgi:hypothetical protein
MRHRSDLAADRKSPSTGLNEADGVGRRSLRDLAPQSRSHVRLPLAPQREY